MAIKSKEWFYKQCLTEVGSHGRFCHLAWSVLEKGIGQSDSTRGHVTQAIGGAQRFLERHPQHVEVIRATDPTLPFDFRQHPDVQSDMQRWLRRQTGQFGKSSFGFNFDTLRGILTRSLGGHRSGGGGADDEFKRVIRLLAEFID